MAKSHTLDAMRLPELQARFKEVTGEATRSPNRKFLIRRIEEGLAKQPAKSQKRDDNLSVEALRAKYLEVVGRPSGSSSKPYLHWKIRQAEHGRVPVGPRPSRRREGEPTDVRVLPLRLQSGTVDQMDAAWRAHGLPNRTEFLRQAIGRHLKELGASEAAAMFLTEG